MKIDSSTFSVPLLRSTGQSAAKSAETPAKSAEAVSLSSLANAIQGNDKPPVNAARIQEIKDAIAQGRFKINPEAIADGLIETARSLTDKQQRQA